MAELPDNYHMTIITIPDDLGIESVAVSDLQDDWNGPTATGETKDIGTRWSRRESSAVLRVPSVIVSEEHNYLLNLRHPDFQRIRFHSSKPFRFDFRLRPVTQ